jgi:uncharacterized protein DUF5985
MTDGILYAVVMASATVGLFFLRFWRDTRDRLFLMFALAFWALAANWLGLAVYSDQTVEARTPFYVLRLLAFLLIVVAIADKNRAAARSARPPGPRRTNGYAPAATTPAVGSTQLSQAPQAGASVSPK